MTVGIRSCVLAVMAALLVASGGVSPVQAVQPDEVLSDTSLEKRARSLSAGLRCLVCQNQSIDDSDAPLAKDLRVLVRERLVAGDSDEQVIDYVVARYGDFVLLKPPMNTHTVLLWATPLLVLGVVAVFILRNMRKRSPATLKGAAPLTPEEEQELRKVLKSAGEPGSTPG